MNHNEVSLIDLDPNRPDIETQILSRIRKIDEALLQAKWGEIVVNERSLMETRKALCEWHYAFCGNW